MLSSIIFHNFVNMGSEENRKLQIINDTELSLNNDFRYTYPEDYRVTNLDIFWTVVSIVMRLTNVILNIILAIEYYGKDEINHFLLTTVCIIVPMIVTTLLSINMYVQDKKSLKRYDLLKVVIFVIVLPFLFRYCQSLSYAIASKSAERKGDKDKQKMYFKRMMNEESDVALIRIFECFLEAAPQKVLQLSIILREGYNMTWIQFATISGCACSLAWCMVVYHRYNRYTQADKEQITRLGVIGQCCWHFSIAVSRVLCISVIASVFPLWTLVAFTCRVLLTSLILLIFDKPNFCSTSIYCSFAFCLILGIVYIFTYIIPKEGRTRYRFAIYFVICLLENVACISLFVIYAENNVKASAFFFPLCVFSIAMYLVGIIFMILYYTTCHPNITAHNLQ